MDGQSITWPWWYRILNLVLQPLIFQPGATVEDIHANCDEYTTEIFEIELVLQWLVSLDAVKKTIGGGYITLPGVWAAFGDVLHDMEDDWLNSHVQRKHQKHEKQQWRDSYHLRYSTLQGRDAVRYLSQSDDSDESDTQTDNARAVTTNSSQKIMRHPKEQYAIVREYIDTQSAIEVDSTDSLQQTTQLTAAVNFGIVQVQAQDAPQTRDVEMEDANAEGQIDAEGVVEI